MAIRAHTPTTYGQVDAFVDQVQSEGRYAFAESDLVERVSVSAKGRELALRRLARAGRIARPLPKQGFFVVVPPEFRSMGAPPLDWYVDPLMRFLGDPAYYVGLLTAAEWHGASHFAIQETHIVVTHRLQPVSIGRERLRFVLDATSASTPVEERMTDAGSVRVSTAEATALDLVRHLSVVGDLGIVATALAEMTLDPSNLVGALDAIGDVTATQRLGHLLDLAGQDAAADAVGWWLAPRPRRIRVLDPRQGKQGGSFSPRWKLHINAQVEVSA